jgi:REP element-mobilizing transposase RayT
MARFSKTRASLPSARPHEAPMPDPLGYLLTWTTYGTWLPGDGRGWVKRGKGHQTPDRAREERARRRMTEPACELDQEQRALVEETIEDHCRIRGWDLFAVNCRTNHVHVVVAANVRPENVRDQFKAWCTTKLNEWQRSRYQRGRENWWTKRGSERYLNNEDDLESAIRYVRDGQ